MVEEQQHRPFFAGSGVDPFRASFQSWQFPIHLPIHHLVQGIAQTVHGFVGGEDRPEHVSAGWGWTDVLGNFHSFSQDGR